VTDEEFGPRSARCDSTTVPFLSDVPTSHIIFKKPMRAEHFVLPDTKSFISLLFQFYFNYVDSFIDTQMD